MTHKALSFVKSALRMAACIGWIGYFHATPLLVVTSILFLVAEVIGIAEEFGTP